MQNTIQLINNNGLLAISGKDISMSYKFDQMEAGLTLSEVDEDRILIKRYAEDYDTFAGEFDANNMLDLDALHAELFNLREMGVIQRWIKYARFPSGHVNHPLAF